MRIVEQRKQICDEFFEYAKELLVKDGSHDMLIFIIKGEDVILFPGLPGLEKYQYAGMASEVAKKIDADLILSISESYVSMKKPDDPVHDDPKFKPSEDPNHREALTTILSDPYGDAYVKMVFFKKINDKIIFEEEQVMDGGHFKMIPPWKEPIKH